jgi:hypothetical protein
MGTIILLQAHAELDGKLQSLPSLDHDDAVALVDSPDELIAHVWQRAG